MRYVADQTYGSLALTVPIRDASPSDSQQVAALLCELGYTVPVRLVVERLQRLSMGNSRVLVAEDGGELLGMLAISWQEWLSHERPLARVTELVVASTARRRGIGRRLVEAAVEIASAAGCELIELTTGVARDDAHAFYAALGFERTSYRYARRLGEP